MFDGFTFPIGFRNKTVLMCIVLIDIVLHDSAASDSKVLSVESGSRHGKRFNTRPVFLRFRVSILDLLTMGLQIMSLYK